MKAKSRTTQLFVSVTVGSTLLFGVAACSDTPTAKPQGEQIAGNRQNYVPKNDVEGRNYNGRQRLADEPSTLLWCTGYPTSPNAKSFTVPIVGKLTSGNKRPYYTSQEVLDSDTMGYTYSPEVAGPDGMYGSSGEYRYGFDPAGNYHEFYGLEVYCSTIPNVVMKETTHMLITVEATAALDSRVQDALKQCQKKNPDQTARCDAAAKLLGI